MQWYDFHENSQGVGRLNVLVHGATGLAGDTCLCILQLGAETLRTHSDIKTNDPNWMTMFNFNVKDVTSILEITVHDEQSSKNIGFLSISLLNIENDEIKWFALKDFTLRERAKGNNPKILLEMKLTWYIINASLRIISPKDTHYIEIEEKLNRHTFSRNLTRAKVILNWMLDAWTTVKTCFEQESWEENILALAKWLIFCWFFDMWMVPLLLLLPFSWYRPPKYALTRWTVDLFKRNRVKDEYKREKKLSLIQRISSVHDKAQGAQNTIGDFANLGESIKNLFNFSVPFLSILAILFILTTTVLLYIIPMNYIFMIWGVSKFTRKILQPNRIANNEVLDLLSRVPNDEILMDCEELPLNENLDEELT